MLFSVVVGFSVIIYDTNTYRRIEPRCVFGISSALGELVSVGFAAVLYASVVNDEIGATRPSTTFGVHPFVVLQQRTTGGLRGGDFQMTGGGCCSPAAARSMIISLFIPTTRSGWRLWWVLDFGECSQLGTWGETCACEASW